MVDKPSFRTLNERPTLPVYAGIYDQLCKLVSRTLKELLEHGNLYQSRTVDLKEVNLKEERFGWLKGQMAGRSWIPLDSMGAQRVGSSPQDPTVAPVYFRPPSGVKLFCTQCSSSEAYNPGIAMSVTCSSHHDTEMTTGAVTYVLGYQCQHCKREPEVFLVRRANLKLQICGRSPIEHAVVPSEIPESVAQWYRDATVAYQSGKTLAGLLYLRTIVEQWSRLTTGDRTAKAEALLDAYMATLPNKFSDNFPSMRKLYGDLSAAIHEAREDQKLFESAQAEIAEHFQARKLLRIDLNMG